MEATSAVVAELNTACSTAAAEEARPREKEVDIEVPPHDEPWGQRRFNIWSPEGVLIEVLQIIEPEWMAKQGL